MSITNFLHLEADAIAENPVRIPFKWDFKDNIPPNVDLGDELIINPITVQTWFRIKPLIMDIERNDFDNLIQKPVSSIPDIELINLIGKYDTTLLQIIFLGLHNQPGELEDWKKKALADNCTWSDIFILANAVLFRIGQQSFRKSITVLQNVSPLTEPEIIAAQSNLESWKTAQIAQ